ncbi:hypothetical protein [Mycolicibacterium fortuitum]|nr:hypothetical protein [Mycolicibacterium fortuitum]
MPTTAAWQAVLNLTNEYLGPWTCSHMPKPPEGLCPDAFAVSF